jgi:hypothetical protein
VGRQALDDGYPEVGFGSEADMDAQVFFSAHVCPLLSAAETSIGV